MYDKQETYHILWVIRWGQGECVCGGGEGGEVPFQNNLRPHYHISNICKTYFTSLRIMCLLCYGINVTGINLEGV